jgi:hypothetical protein
LTKELPKVEDIFPQNTHLLSGKHAGTRTFEPGSNLPISMMSKFGFHLCFLGRGYMGPEWVSPMRGQINPGCAHHSWINSSWSPGINALSSQTLPVRLLLYLYCLLCCGCFLNCLVNECLLSREIDNN